MPLLLRSDVIVHTETFINTYTYTHLHTYAHPGREIYVCRFHPEFSCINDKTVLRRKLMFSHYATGAADIC